ncbi:hypothetical protein AB0J86_06990 [Micromonospora sp. NPDC049559]|uniref:hypothetical protein n=1 Tax=Micromonospora sp. NPDC049559 TaxID=3155923 RepID=UPI00341A1107
MSGGRQPESGDVLVITRAASVQFVVPIYFRVIRVPGWETYHGWLWLEGYELDGRGEAKERRHIFVQLDGLRWVRPRPVVRPRPRAAGANQRLSGRPAGG